MSYEEKVTVAEVRAQIEKLMPQKDRGAQPLIDFYNSKLETASSKEDAAMIVINSHDLHRISELHLNLYVGLSKNWDGIIGTMNNDLDDMIQQSNERSVYMRATDPRNQIHHHVPKSAYRFH